MAVGSAASGKKGPLRNILASFKELFTNRWLIFYFTQRQFTRNYRGSFLGFLWAFLSPLFLVALYTLVFSEMIGFRFREIPGEGNSLNFGLYLYAGLLPFLAYAEALNKGVATIRGSANLVQKVVFPLQALPISTAVSALADKLFGVVVLIGFYYFMSGTLHGTVLLMPLILVPQLLFSLGLGYLFAVIGTYLPDASETLRSLVRASFFITPIIWPPSRLPADYQWIIDYNPVAFMVQTYRDFIILGEIPGWIPLAKFGLFSAAICLVGFIVFNLLKKNFADLI